MYTLGRFITQLSICFNCVRNFVEPKWHATARTVHNSDADVQKRNRLDANSAKVVSLALLEQDCNSVEHPVSTTREPYLA